MPHTSYRRGGIVEKLCTHPYKMKGAVRYPTILETATFPDRIVRKHFLYVYVTGTLAIDAPKIETFSQKNNTHAGHRRYNIHSHPSSSHSFSHPLVNPIPTRFPKGHTTSYSLHLSEHNPTSIQLSKPNNLHKSPPIPTSRQIYT